MHNNTDPAAFRTPSSTLDVLSGTSANAKLPGYLLESKPIGRLIRWFLNPTAIACTVCCPQSRMTFRMSKTEGVSAGRDQGFFVHGGEEIRYHQRNNISYTSTFHSHGRLSVCRRVSVCLREEARGSLFMVGKRSDITNATTFPIPAHSTCYLYIKIYSELRNQFRVYQWMFQLDEVLEGRA